MELWHHQKRVFDLLMNGENVVLQAPTGSGKTRAALHPFLYALGDTGSDDHRAMPQKCIYSVPMRVLAKQFHTEAEKMVKERGLHIDVKIQTGEQQEDRELAGNLIFATIDQTLSSFLLAPYSLSRRKANLNAGAVMASYLVFDEFHLYEPDSTLPTTLHMLQALQGITPFVLMTATFSMDMLDELSALLKAEIVPQTQAERDELHRLPPQHKTRRYHVAEQPLSATAVLGKHNRRSLVICNTVDRARYIYEALCEATEGTKILLLHSRFLPEHRKKIEEKIRARFGEDDTTGGSLIAVSTQAIEVGVDITSAALHTELAPANAVIQRAGRCARYEGDEGDVYIYAQTLYEGESVDLTENVMPYRSQTDQFQTTLDQFHERSGSKLDFADEQAVITAVHGERDRQIIGQLKSTSFAHQRNIYSVMRGEKLTDPRHLIREVASQQVTIHANPDELLDAPYDAPSFGLHPGTVQGYVNGWLERFYEDTNIPWALKWLSEEMDEDAEQANRTIYRWIEVRDHAREVRGAPLIVVHPALATYDERLGFLADRGGSWQTHLPRREARSEGGNRFTYRLETYEEHIKQVYRAFEEFWPEMDYAARRLEARYGWQPGSVERAARLAVLLHDVGKLSAGWQGWVREYQAKINMPVEAGKAYAHTHQQDDHHREVEGRMKRRPWHAVESALASAHLLIELLNNDALAQAAFSAIARHHAPHSSANQSFQLVPNALDHIAAMLGHPVDPASVYGFETAISANDSYCEEISEPDDSESYLPYLIIIRALRRADTTGTERGSKGTE